MEEEGGGGEGGRRRGGGEEVAFITVPAVTGEASTVEKSAEHNHVYGALHSLRFLAS